MTAYAPSLVAHALPSLPLIVTSRHCLSSRTRSRAFRRARAGKVVAVAVVRCLIAVLWLFAALMASALLAQDRSSFQIPAEYDNYMAALNTRDPGKRATAMEVFVAWYPGSILRTEALQ